MHNVILNGIKNSCLKLTGFLHQRKQQCSVFSEKIYLKTDSSFTSPELSFKDYSLGYELFENIVVAHFLP